MSGTEHGDASRGFTLVELLLSIAILIIVLGSLSTAILVFLSNGRETLERDDHSGGAAILGSYLDRDVASADTITPGGNACSGVSNVVSMSWHEYSASNSAPTPSPSGEAYRVAYTVVTDANSVPAGGAPRFKLQRIECRGAAVTDRSDLVPNLTDDSTRVKALETDVLPATCASRKLLTFNLEAYNEDSTLPYTFQTCTRTRLTP